MKDTLLNPYWRMDHLYHIRSSNGIERFKMRDYQRYLNNEMQAKVDAGESSKYIILKNRQNGTTTFCSLFTMNNVAYRKGKVGNTVADTRDRASSVFDNVAKFAFDRIPERIRPTIERDNVQELNFGAIGSKYIVSATKSEPVDILHISEAPYFIHQERITEALQMVRENGLTIMESTAYGVGNVFEQIFTEAWACKTKGEYHHWNPVFFPWFTDPTNVVRVVDGMKIKNTDLIDELVDKYNITEEQQYFYDQKYSDLEDEVFQFYPSEPLEAFLQSGRPVFNQKLLANLRVANEKRPTHTENDFVFYEELDEGMYGIGVDPAEGLANGDNAVISGVNSQGKEAFQLAGKFDPHELAEKMEWIAQRVNHCMVVERNNHGHAVIAESRHSPYINFYRTEVVDSVTHKTSFKIGWDTNEKSKAHLISQMKKGLAQGTLIPQDAHTYTELIYFVHGDRGKMQAQQGKNDDRVMALGLANIGAAQEIIESATSADEYGII